MSLMGIGFGLLMGISLGMLGGGGSILTVPILIYVLGLGAREAIAVSLAIVGVTSLVGAIGHWRAGQVNIRVALIFGAVAMVGTYLGARLSVFVSETFQLSLFAVVMLVAAVSMFRTGGSGSEPGAPGHPSARGKTMSFWLIVFEGIAIGILTGLVGVGGGFLVVPVLVILGRLPMKQAIGTSLLVIAIKSGGGFVGYLGQVEIPWAIAGWFTLVAVIGIILGTYLTDFVENRALQRAFALLLVVMGSWILYQNSGITAGPDPARSSAVERRIALGVPSVTKFTAPLSEEPAFHRGR